jgi:Asp-tRNA(Asn)/Glu-tRNA(Gln) amidotransferase C subunit
MAITREEVRHVATLFRLGLSEEDIARFCSLPFNVICSLIR